MKYSNQVPTALDETDTALGTDTATGNGFSGLNAKCTKSNNLTIT